MTADAKTMPSRLWWRLLYACGLAYLALLPAFYKTTNLDTRFAMRWNGTDYFSILMAVGGFALAIWVLYGLVDEVIRRLPHRECLSAGFRWVCGIVVCYLCLRSFRMILEMSGSGAWLETILRIRPIRYGLYLGLPVVLGLILRNRFKVVARRLCVFGAILGALFVVTAATYHRFEVARQNEPLPESGAELGQAGGSMFLLIFDECAYPRVFPQDALREDMPNFRAFGACATIYRRCYSEGSETPLSIPRLLLKDDSPLRATDARRLMRDVSGGKLKPGASLFTDATNFFRAVTGLHLDYEQLVGDDVEYVSTSIFRSRMPFFEKVMRVWLDAFPVLGRVIERPILAETGMFIESVQESERLLAALAARTAKEPVFAVCHLALPHYPFVWDARGLLEERAGRPIHELTKQVEGYEGNLRYMDAVFGRFLDQLREVDQFDDSLLIVTSDHAWREDPALPPYDLSAADGEPFSAYKHVPLWIKAPGQTVGEVVDRPIHLRALQPLVSRWIAGEPVSSVLE